MDFNYLIEIAKMNDQKNKKEDNKFFPSKLSKAKKVERPAPKSEAVKALLDQKEKDKKQKNLQFIKERKELEERRSLDKKNNRKIRAMIYRTKGASKSVLDEAKDLITTNGEEQCDDDDYGYESTMSQQIFNKLTTEYREAPEDNRLLFKKTSKGNINDIKNRVMDSLKRKHEEDTGVRKRKRTRKRKTHKEDQFINDGDPYGYKEAKSHEKNKKDDNLQHCERVEEEKVPKKIKKPMIPTMSFEEIIKVAKKKQHDPFPVAPVVEVTNEPEERPLTAKEKAEKESERLRKLRRMWKLPEASQSGVQKENSEDNSKKAAKVTKIANAKTPIEQKKEKVIDRSKYFAVPNSVSVRKENVSKILKAPPVHPAMMKKPVKPPVQSNCIESDEEYDSEMDDFIDDGDMEMDVSSEIGKIFGYDKSIYRHIDAEDDSTMEASYSQMQKEENVSAKIGLKEDKDDMRKEEEEKKRKMQRKMKLEKAFKRK